MASSLDKGFAFQRPCYSWGDVAWVEFDTSGQQPPPPYYDHSYGGGLEYANFAPFPSRPPEKFSSYGTKLGWCGDGRDFVSVLQWYCYWLGINPAICCQLPAEVVTAEILKQGAQEREVLPSPGPPHEAFRYVIHYLGLQELLSLEMVCKPLLEMVRREAPHWQNLRLDPPLDLKLTDTALLILALRAQGRLQSLKLANCQRITDASLESVLAGNTMLTKLDVSCCKGLTIEGVVKMAQRHTLPGYQRLRRLRVEGLNDITKERIQELREALCPDKCWPLYYRLTHRGYGDRVLDVEACPRCDLLRVVYDCWRTKCHEKWSAGEQQCRGCLSCVPRCDNCGGCFENGDFEETFALDFMCLKCSRLPVEATFPGTGFGCGSLSFHDQKTVEEEWRLKQQRQEQEEGKKRAILGDGSIGRNGMMLLATMEGSSREKTNKNHSYSNTNNTTIGKNNKINHSINDSFVGGRRQ
ncbi:hypothetical protein SELMODRAFT_443977 [Selaginella moellendorffii]|uniref:F-box domain-containing protein n=1 Tax=Selaginella moellendorffii TaxID=88036 RepID=D8S5Z3_SELML|nr:F-box protein SKIP14 [Selaginella moellendorffii]EFJ20258.1 hypothetical protein SELMODRAFT_443977 [Selaginella moellendorffii]|eukprot:XP_002978811.1 F-box protein SKIP14 [Selaginella moellendorffii]